MLTAPPVAERSRHDAPRPDVGAITWIVLGAGAGAALGAVSRGWMRLISDDPEFTWNGTIFIVIAFTMAGAGFGIARAGRRSRRRRATTTARTFGGVLAMALFVGAGGVMLPTVVSASLGRWRSDWPRPARWAMVLIAAPIPVMLLGDAWDDGLHWRKPAGLLLMAATYVIIIGAASTVVAPIRDGWRLPRPARVLLIVAGVALLIAIALLSGALATSDLA